MSVNKARNKEQRAVCKAVNGRLLNFNRVQYVFPSGGGKTYIAIMLIDGRLRAVILVPNTMLVEQTILEYQARGKGKRSIGAICSTTPPTGVTKLSSVENIKEFLLKDTFLIVCTYQSQHKLIEACEKKKKIDLVICDEAHRTTGRADKPWGRILSSAISKKFVFQTATAKTYNPILKSNTNINCQLDEKIYGKNVYTLSMKAARELGFIIDFKVCVLVDNEKLIGKKKISKGVIQKVAQKHNNRSPTDYEIALVANSIREAHKQGYRKILAYANRRCDAQFFADLLIALQGYAGLPKLIHDSTGDKNANVFISLQEHREIRGTIIERFSKRRGLSILFSCQTLTEGVNIPVADCAVLLAPRGSDIDITQLIGRLLRLHPDKDKPALLVLSAIVQDMAEFEYKDTFRAVRTVIYALRNYDDSWQVEVNALANMTDATVGIMITDRLQLTTPPARLKDITVKIGTKEWKTLTVSQAAMGILQTARGVAKKHGIQI